MNRQERIEVLQDWVEHGHLLTADALKNACKVQKVYEGEDIDWFDDILAPLEWNCCDRCGALCPSEELFWLDYCEPSEELIAGAVNEQVDYCAICEGCAKELTEKGKENNMDRKKYDIDYADDVKMWELVRFNKLSEEWECMGIYAEDEKEGDKLANLYETNDIYDYLDLKKGE